MKTITDVEATIIERNLAVVDDASQITPMEFPRSNYVSLYDRGYLTFYPFGKKHVWLATPLGKLALMCYRVQKNFNIE